MAYINGLRAFYTRSQGKSSRSARKKRPSTKHWQSALSKAESALEILRKGANLAIEKRYQEAEAAASRSIELLKERSVTAFNHL
jgi:hypothetical protein